MAQKLGESLIEKGLINEEQLQTALQHQSRTGEFLGEILIKLKFVTEDDLLKVLASQFNTRYVSLERVRVNPVVLKMVPRQLAWEYKFLPIEMRAGVILIAVSNPLDMWPMSALQEKITDISEVQIVLAKKDDITQAIMKHYGNEGAL